MHDFIIQVVDEHVHDEGHFVIHVLLSNVGDGLFELFAPLFLDVEGLALVLLRLQVFVEESLQLLPLVLLTQTLFLDRREVFVHVFGNRVLLFIDLG